MIPPDIVNRVRLLTEQFRPALPAISDVEREISAVAPVGRVIAEVGPCLPDGRYQVFAAGQRFEMELPPDAKPGDRIALMLSTNSASGNARAPASSATNAASTTAGAPTTPPPSQPAPESVQLRMSDAARLVEGFTKPGSEQAAPASLTSTEPLLPAAPADAKVAAAALREFIATSGLFYESHQAQWVAGERSVAVVREEPQARIKPLQHEQVNNAPMPAVRNETEAAPLNSLLSTANEQTSSAPADGARPQLVHPATTQLVQQQINALESQRIIWSGPVWPGQAMRWEIVELTRHEDTPQADQAWQTQIDIELPKLGAITANLLLDKRGVSVRLRAPVDSTGATLATAFGELRAALHAAGITVSELVRENHEHA
jgi:hypothetical protein